MKVTIRIISSELDEEVNFNVHKVKKHITEDR